jgi:5-bromo-4-chloroindolyl phosphate hydrolysis protein
MESNDQQEREVRAARNQAMFRAVNERLEDLNKAFESATDTFTIACECADTNCVEMLDIRHDEYSKVREQPRHFAVLPGHVYPDVERIVEESERYVVVEKYRLAGELAEALAKESPAD